MSWEEEDELGRGGGAGKRRMSWEEEEELGRGG